MLDGQQHRMIGKIFEMLENIPEELFEQSNLYLDVKLKDKYGGYEIVFEDETGDWTYRLVNRDA